MYLSGRYKHWIARAFPLLPQMKITKAEVNQGYLAYAIKKQVVLQIATLNINGRFLDIALYINE